jgi:hypothetical protein
MKQLEIPGTYPMCETGDLEHEITPAVAVGEFLYGDDWVWMCDSCRHVVWPNDPWGGKG